MGRLGGEEFGLAITCNDVVTATRTIERVCDTLAQSPLKTSSGPIPVTASFGLAGGSQISVESVDILYKLADTACYEAKETGRNRVCAFRGDAKNDRDSLASVAPA